MYAFLCILSDLCFQSFEEIPKILTSIKVHPIVIVNIIGFVVCTAVSFKFTACGLKREEELKKFLEKVDEL